MVDPNPEKDDNMNELVSNLFYIFIFLFLGIYFIVESGFKKYRPRLGHTSGVIVLLGIAASYIIWTEVNAYNKTADREVQVVMANLQFDPSLFFHLILPTIIFPSGYNMRRKKFFRNIKTIFKFGFMGTLICFCFYTAMLSYADKLDILLKWDFQTQSYVSL